MKDWTRFFAAQLTVADMAPVCAPVNEGPVDRSMTDAVMLDREMASAVSKIWRRETYRKHKKMMAERN